MHTRAHNPFTTIHTEGALLPTDLLQREWFQSLAEAQVVIEAWRLHYNTQRPHSSLDYQTPAAFAARHTH